MDHSKKQVLSASEGSSPVQSTDTGLYSPVTTSAHGMSDQNEELVENGGGWITARKRGEKQEGGQSATTSPLPAVLPPDFIASNRYDLLPPLPLDNGASVQDSKAKPSLSRQQNVMEEKKKKLRSTRKQHLLKKVGSALSPTAIFSYGIYKQAATAVSALSSAPSTPSASPTLTRLRKAMQHRMSIASRMDVDGIGCQILSNCRRELIHRIKQMVKWSKRKQQAERNDEEAERNRQK